MKQEIIYNTQTSRYEYYERNTSTNVDSFYEQNDTVFVYNKLFNQYTPLYIYNAQEGDTITLPIVDTFNLEYVTNFDSTMTFVIDSIRMVDYNGTQLATYYTSSVVNIDWASVPNGNFVFFYNIFNPATNWSTDLVMKKTMNPFINNPSWADSSWVIYTRGAYSRLVGGLGSGLLPANEYVHNGRIADGFSHTFTSLRCYTDNNVQIQMDTVCDSFTVNIPLGIEKVNAAIDIQLFPNPIAKDNSLHITSKQPFPSQTTVHLYDLMGREVIHPVTLDHAYEYKTDLGRLIPGTYICIIQIADKKYYHKLVKQ